MSRGMRYDIADRRAAARAADTAMHDRMPIGTGSLPATQQQMRLIGELAARTGAELPRTHPTRNVARDWIKRARVRATLDAFREDGSKGRET